MAKGRTAKPKTSGTKNVGTRNQTLSRKDPDLGSLLPVTGNLVRRFRDEVDRLFQDFGFDNLTNALPTVESIGLGVWAPQIEIFERGGQVVVRADLPGLTRDDIRIDLTEKAITITGERKQEYENNENEYYRSERSYGYFSRRIPLPDGVDIETAEAQFSNGVLELTFAQPERKEAKARKLEIGDRPLAARAKAAGR